MSSAHHAEKASAWHLPITRRLFLTGVASTALAGCTTTSSPSPKISTSLPTAYREFAGMYAATPTERFPIPAIDVSKIDPRYFRQQVTYSTSEPPGTIIVDPSSNFLYLVQEHGTALRYGVGVGREGFGWTGRANIRRKAEWPTWTPPASMIAREPELAKYAGGMPPGLDNPLGARALYLYQGRRDTLYRLHGTNEPWSIGQSVSSGCIRLFNQDIIDLYNRTPIGTAVVVLEGRGSLLSESGRKEQVTPSWWAT
jgi:lipoprotein-anchoring transpeptidase ErfK/SrfK